MPGFRPLSICAAMVLTASSTQLLAQKVEITPFAGFRTSGSFGETESVLFEDVEAQQGGSAGANLTFSLGESWQLELFYSTQDAEFEGQDTNTGGEVHLFDAAIEQIHVGGSYQGRRSGGRIRPFVAASLGATRFVPDGDVDTETRASFSAGGGLKVFLTEHLGFRLQGRINSTYIDSDEETFCDDDLDICVEVPDPVYFYQGEVLAGLILAF